MRHNFSSPMHRLFTYVGTLLPALRRPNEGLCRYSSSAAVAALLSFALFTPASANGEAAVQISATMGTWRLSTGSEIAYTKVNALPSPTRSPIVYLHGGPGVPSRNSNIEFLKEFARQGHDIFIYDQAGVGRSALLDNISLYSLERHLADLQAIQKVIGAEKLILVGASWGAVLGAHYIAQNPGSVERAVFLSPGILADRKSVQHDYKPTASSENDEVLIPPARMIAAGMLARISPKAAESFASQKDMNVIFDEFLATPSLEYGTHCKGYVPNSKASRAKGGNYYGNLMVLQSLKSAPNPIPRLSKLDLPVLIIRGECDYIPEVVAKSYEQAFKGSRLIRIPNAGHAVVDSAPLPVFSAIKDFLSGRELAK